MALDIAGAIMQISNTAVSITTNSNVGLNFNSSGIPILGNRPYFIATQNLAQWNNYNSGGWLVLPFSNSYVNNGSGYNTSTYAFTAPVTGTYWFGHSSYSYKYAATNPDSYIHPTFLVNGNQTARQASATTPYRLRLRTYYSGGYSGDTQINDIYYLTAGDYVQVYSYSSGALQWYGNESHFCGFLIG